MFKLKGDCSIINNSSEYWRTDHSTIGKELCFEGSDLRDDEIVYPNILMYQNSSKTCSIMNNSIQKQENSSENINFTENKNEDFESDNQSWTCEEDKLLLSLVENSYGKNWKKICLQFRKSAQQCSYRFNKLMSSINNKKWTRNDDIKLIEIAESLNKNWPLISKHFANRSIIELEERYEMKLDPTKKRGKFEKHEDELILAMYEKLGNKWEEIAKHIPNRHHSMIKNRFYSFLKKKVEHQSNSRTASTGRKSHSDNASVMSMMTSTTIERKLTDNSENQDFMGHKSSRRSSIPYSGQNCNSLNTIQHIGSEERIRKTVSYNPLICREEMEPPEMQLSCSNNSTPTLTFLKNLKSNSRRNFSKPKSQKTTSLSTNSLPITTASYNTKIIIPLLEEEDEIILKNHKKQKQESNESLFCKKEKAKCCESYNTINSNNKNNCPQQTIENIGVIENICCMDNSCPCKNPCNTLFISPKNTTSFFLPNSVNIHSNSQGQGECCPFISPGSNLNNQNKKEEYNRAILNCNFDFVNNNNSYSNFSFKKLQENENPDQLQFSKPISSFLEQRSSSNSNEDGNKLSYFLMKSDQFSPPCRLNKSNNFKDSYNKAFLGGEGFFCSEPIDDFILNNSECVQEKSSPNNIKEEEIYKNENELLFKQTQMLEEIYSNVILHTSNRIRINLSEKRIEKLSNTQLQIIQLDEQLNEKKNELSFKLRNLKNDYNDILLHCKQFNMPNTEAIKQSFLTQIDILMELINITKMKINLIQQFELAPENCNFDFLK
jgi:hypothetical protein